MNHNVIAGLRHAVPYLRLYRDCLFVVKVGGEAFVDQNSAHRLLEQIWVLHSLGIGLVLVHGGGVQADALAKELGVEFEKIQGRRVTSREMLRSMILAMNGEVQGRILSACRAIGISASGVSGMDAGLVTAVRRKPTFLEGQTVDMGEVGDVVSVNGDVLFQMLGAGTLPIVSSLCGDEEGNWLNVNADTVASRIAVELGAQKMIFMTGAQGILADPNDPTSLLSELSLEEMRGCIESGQIRDGMLPKASAIEYCLTEGVPKVHVVSHSIPDALLTEVFTNEGSGTLIQS